MELGDALRLLRPGSLVCFRRRPRSNDWGLGVVEQVTSRGGILIDEHDAANPRIRLDRQVWIPFNRILEHLPPPRRS